MIRERDFGFTPKASFPANQRDGYLRRQRRDLYKPQFTAGKLFAQIPFRYQGNAEAGFDTRFCAVMLSTSVVFGGTPTSVANCFSSASFSEARAFGAAGTDYLYAPGLKTVPEMKKVMDAVSTPPNIVMGFADPNITLAELAEIGVRRVSIGAGFYRVAMAAAVDAAQQMKDGDFTFVNDMIGIGKLYSAFR